MRELSAPITKTHPALAGEWDWDKNEGSPNDISHGGCAQKGTNTLCLRLTALIKGKNVIYVPIT